MSGNENDNPIESGSSWKAIFHRVKKSDVIIAAIIAGVFALIAALISSGKPPASSVKTSASSEIKPLYSIEKPVVSSQTPIVIIAKNDEARHKKKLDVKFDRLDFNEGGIPHSDKTIFRWDFLLSNFDVTEKLLEDGPHRLNIRLSDGTFSPDIPVYFFTKSPVLQAVIKDSEGEKSSKVIEGIAASMLQVPEEEIKIDVIFYNAGTNIDFRIDVEKHTDPEGRYYFHFKTPDIQIPELAQNDPRRTQDFFSLRITDSAGNTHYDTMSYEQFSARGERKFGVNSLLDIKTNNIEGVSKNSFAVNFDVIPRTQKVESEVDGAPAILLKVKGHVKGGKADRNELSWEMAEKIRQEQPISIVIRNNKKISVEFGNEFIDENPEKENVYQIEAKGKDGKRYISNEASPTKNRPPVADAGEDKVVEIDLEGNSSEVLQFKTPEPIELDGSRSYDPDGDKLYFRWEYVSTPTGSSGSIGSPKNSKASLYFNKLGVYKLQLYVLDGQLSATDELVIEVKEKKIKGIAKPKIGTMRPKEADTEKNVVEPEMVFVKGGCFQMGDTFGDGEKNEQPVHEVCLDDFYMDKTEVTQKVYEEVMGENPSHFKDCLNCPVENVAWGDAKTYCEKLGGRLPTEAEWEYAARSGGKNEKYAGTSDESKLDRYAWIFNNAENKTHAVGTKEPNGLGLYDMSGNVWEWVSDWYVEGYYQKSPPNNPQGASSGISKVLRGGSFSFISDAARCACRNWSNPYVRGSYVGFRCARTK